MYWYFVVFVFGLAIGSFLNVCIYRIPRDESIAYPPSKCTNCDTPIKFYDNIPVLSYILLGGKCRNCKQKILLIYPIVELLTAIILLVGAINWGFTYPFLIWIFLSTSLIIVFFIDLKHKIIPVSPFIFLIPIILRIIDVLVIQKEGIIEFFVQYGIGGAAGFILLLIIKLISKPIFKREAMGMGDVYLFLYLGLFLGWESILYILFSASLIGALVSIVILMIKKIKDREIPFGPFIVIASLLFYFFREEILKVFNITEIFKDLIFIIKISLQG